MQRYVFVFLGDMYFALEEDANRIKIEMHVIYSMHSFKVIDYKQKLAIIFFYMNFVQQD